jgi:spoIIIJ-associated protein
MEWLEFTAKTVGEALTEALIKLETTSDNVDYEVIEKESSGFLGLFNSKPARIRVKMKFSVVNLAKDFLEKVFQAMNVDARVEVNYEEEDSLVDINVIGDDMGVLIGKRGQTLDSLQYLVSLVLNKGSEGYLKVKLDTENYRQRRKETLENLGRNIAYKVKRTRKSVSLEPMNPYEFVETHSEGEEPYRRVVITLKKGVPNREYKYNRNKYPYGSSSNKEYSSIYKKNKEAGQKHNEEE